MEERLQKLLSACGLASRRTVEQWIEAGRVTVNGTKARLGDKADLDRDRIEVDGRPVRPGGDRLYLMLNKPRGYVTTLSDEKGRKTVAELVSGCGRRVWPVGRLDLDSEGLLLLTDDGELTAERGELMSSALSFAEVPVESVITARVDVAAVDVDDPPEEILAYVREQRHSRLPVYADSIDNVIGILQIRKYIKACIKNGGKAVDVRPLLDEPVFVHQSTLIAEVLPELSRRKANLAIVTDNYGGTLGIVTVEDIVEELVGEIWDEDDVVEESFVPLGGGRYEVDAEMTVGEVFDRLDYTDPEDDEELQYKLLGEWTYEQFSYIPREREGFRYHRLDVRIADMKQKRIVKLIVRLLPEETEADAPADAAPEKGGETA